MRSIIICFVLLSIIEVSGYCQVKKDNLIILLTDKSMDDNFIYFGRHLVNEGYTFETTDHEFLTIRTEMKSIGPTLKYRLNISFRDNQIFIRPEMESSGLDLRAKPVLFKWEYSKSQFNIGKVSFDDFNPKLKRYSTDITYLKE